MISIDGESTTTLGKFSTPFLNWTQYSNIGHISAKYRGKLTSLLLLDPPLFIHPRIALALLATDIFMVLVS